MSHFTVAVRVPYEEGMSADKDLVRKRNHEQAVPALIYSRIEALLAPYSENVSYDNEEQRPFMEFKDVEEEERRDYETKNTYMVRLADGRELSAFAEQFRNRNYGLNEPQYKYPEGAVEFQKPVKEVYPDFETYMKEYVLSTRHPEVGNKWGYWHNPNAKWDWYSIGGRWAGYFVADKDIVQVSELIALKDTYLAKEQEAVLKFWKEWNELLDGKEFDPFDGPRDTALSLEWVECKNKSELTGNEFKTVIWERTASSDDPRFDVYKNVTFEDMLKVSSYFNPLRTYAYLSKDGWMAKGDMGWWGCSHEESASAVLEYANKYAELIYGGDPQDFIVFVDCHI